MQIEPRPAISAHGAGGADLEVTLRNPESVRRERRRRLRRWRDALRGSIDRLALLSHRWRALLAAASFAAGLGSFALIHRDPWLAQWLAGLLVVSWLLILFEPVLAARLRLPPVTIRWAVQAVHQETFFFALPFFFATVTWGSPQVLFAAVIGVGALATMWDPLYHGRIAAHRGAFHAFHALAVFVGALVAMPLIAHLTTTQSLAIACAAVPLFALPGVLRAERWRVGVPGVAAVVVLAAVTWFGRAWVPPATLWVHEAAVSTVLDRHAREPGPHRRDLGVAEVHREGVYAFTSVHAPRGLHETVFHRWLHDGAVVDRIPLEIEGGRVEGYRAWSHKLAFPADPRGGWRVQVVTDGGQLIGEVRFRVE